MPAINEASVKAHKARLIGGKPVDAFLWDDELTGFCCKATPADKRAFFVQYRPRGKAQNIKRVHIGYYGKLTVRQALDKAKQLLGEANAGGDPRARHIEEGKAKLAKKAKEAENKAAGALRAAIDRYVSLNRKAGRYWVHKQARLLSKDMAAVLDRPIKTIAHKDVLAVLDAVQARSENAARLLLTDLRPFFKWAVPCIPLEINPMTGVEPPSPAKKRERVLEPQEVKAFWQAAGEASWPFASIYKLLLLTGARREEIAGMKWSELDLDAGVWLLPGSRTKNGRDHRVPLAPPAIATLNRLGVAAIKAGLGYKDGDLLFSTTGHSSPSGFSKAKRALDARMLEILGPRFKEWRVHDLRRTCATGMENLGIDTRVVETALNHVSGTKAGIVGVYQRAEHREVVKAAFEAWGRYIVELTGDPLPSNVVPLKRAVAK
jgi:integrase